MQQLGDNPMIRLCILQAFMLPIGSLPQGSVVVSRLDSHIPEQGAAAHLGTVHAGTPSTVPV